MIVPTMTPEQIYAEVKKDEELLQRTVAKHIRDFGGSVRRSASFPMLKGYTVNSSLTKIGYFVLCHAARKGEWDHPMVFVGTLYSHEGGRNVVQIDSSMRMRIYTPHFFHRFLERDTAVQGSDRVLNAHPELLFLLMCGSMIEEPNMILPAERSKFELDPDYDRYISVCTAGLCLGEKHKQNPNINLINTFIAPDMMFAEEMVLWIMDGTQLLLDDIRRFYPTQAAKAIEKWISALALRPADNATDEAFGKHYEKLLDVHNEIALEFPLRYVGRPQPKRSGKWQRP